jgi:hypothetical protein
MQLQDDELAAYYEYKGLHFANKTQPAEVRPTQHTLAYLAAAAAAAAAGEGGITDAAEPWQPLGAC